ncbi:unnamed protein product [Ectocarpus sp. CCAP 1310/34]|nr:unnamed protein product [Ectocarpus sp. CCAP 1310/34]
MLLSHPFLFLDNAVFFVACTLLLYLKVDQRGKHERLWILSLDEGLLVMVRQWIRVNSIKNGEPNMTAEGFREYLNTDVLPQSVTVRTARSRLHKLGCEYRDRKSGLYFNGHDREDVLAYRVEKYLPAYFEHRDYMEIWIEATSDEAWSWEVQVQAQDRQNDGRVWVCVHAFRETLSELPQHLRERVTSKKTYSDGRRAIFCYQDECIYRANDDQRFAWVPPNYHALKKKGDGQGIMTSGTIVDNVGFVAGDQADIDKAQAFRRKRCDTSATEHAADGAPSATRMNAGYEGVRKGKQLAAQDATTLLVDTPKLKEGTVQYPTFQEGESPFYGPGAEDHIGKLKGLKQEDFASVEPNLVVLVKRHEGVSIMLPKFHCEINPIELVWGRSKYWVWRHCKYTIACLRTNVSKRYAVAEDRLSLAIVQKFCRTVANFNEVYRDGLQGAEAVQKRDTFESHRKPAPSEYINTK